MLTDTTKELYSNQNAVASSSTAKTRDIYNEQMSRWEAPVNSQSASMRNLMGYIENAPKPSACVARIDSDSQRVALEFLRRASVESAVDNSKTDYEVVQQSWRAIHWDLHQQAPAETPSAEQIMNNWRIHPSDIAIAREYLIEESNALQRLQTSYLDEDTPPNARLYGLHSRPFQHPTERWWMSSSANAGAALPGDPGATLTTDYANIGIAQTIDYMREKSNKILKMVEDQDLTLSDKLATIIGKTSLFAEQFIGKRRVEAYGRYYNSDENEFFVEVEGIKPGETAFAVRGEESYRCLLQGSIGGAPCETRDVEILDSSDVILHRNDSQRSALDHYIQLHFIIRNNYDFYVFVRTKKGNEFLTAVDGAFGTQYNERVVIPADPRSKLSGFVGKLTKRNHRDCGAPVDVCSDIGLERNFVPPLENELTENSDQYENSWRHYLEMAEAAAIETDRLGEQLVESSLDIDKRSEAARQELEDLCGGIINRGDQEEGTCETQPGWNDVEDKHKICDPGLAYCLPTEMGGRMKMLDYVSLGRPACIFRWKGSGRGVRVFRRRS